jgi:uncharacterized protein YbjT (DUF2867 family)
MKIVVVGGTGLIGSKLLRNLREQGHDAVAGAPNTGQQASNDEPTGKTHGKAILRLA